jgi:hypothetical protein
VSKLVAKCGIDCGTCPWGPYPRKGMSAEGFERFRSDAKRILGYMPIKTPCLTCQTPDSEIPKGAKLPNRNCLIRLCVDRSRMSNCAYCSRFPCDTLKATAGLWNRRSIEKKLGSPISENEYHGFVEPFERLCCLEAIRASLKPEEIVEPAKATTSETRIIGFPENLPFSKEETASLRAVHKLLTTVLRSSLGLRDVDTFAQHQKLESRRAHVLRFLWILGRYGKLKKEKDVYLTVDAGTYAANRGSEKSLAIWSFVKENVFKVLSEFGVCCELVALEGVREEELATGTGYLRNRGWVMKMSFEERIGGATALEGLQTCTRRLEEKRGKKAFKHFSEADMHILLEKPAEP